MIFAGLPQTASECAFDMFLKVRHIQRRMEQHLNGHAYSTHRLGDKLELASSREVSSLETARKIELQMKRKKNPKLALFLLEQYRRQFSD